MLLYVDSQYASPYALSAFVALHEKSIPFQLETVDLGRSENRAPTYAAKSLTQRIPTLQHEGFTLSESSAITEYLDEVFPSRALYPSEVRARARARQVQAWLRSDFLAIRQERSTEVVFYGRMADPLSSPAQREARKLYAAASALLSEGGQNLLGAWCIADVDLALMLNRLVMGGDAVPEHLALYARKQWERDSVQQWLKQERPPLVCC